MLPIWDEITREEVNKYFKSLPERIRCLKEGNGFQMPY
jgi:hypothetical protein